MAKTYVVNFEVIRMDVKGIMALAIVSKRMAHHHIGMDISKLAVQAKWVLKNAKINF